MIAPFLNQSLALDIIKDAPPAAAYGLRKLKSGYKGAPIRVRRSSDDAELDIPFCGQYLCIGTLIAFVTTNSAYVVTAYDQSGNANHATQSTAANQPRIVNAGIIDRDFDATKANVLYPTFVSASGGTIVTNGNFVDTTGWAGTSSTRTATSNILTATGTGTSSSAQNFQTKSLAPTIGKRYFFRGTLRVTNSSCVQIRIALGDDTSGEVTAGRITQGNPVQNQWYTLSGVINITSAWAGNLRIYISQEYADAATANGKVMEVQEVVCVDVTELGQPTMYFDGTNDVMTIANSASVDILGAPLMMNAVFKPIAAGYIISKNLDSGATLQYAIVYNQTSPHIDLFLEGSTIRQSTANDSTPINTQKIVSEEFTTGVQKGYVNGVSSGTDGNTNTALTSRANMQIGARSNNAGGTAWASFFNGNISEIIILTSTSGRSKLERNQGKFYQLGVA